MDGKTIRLVTYGLWLLVTFVLLFFLFYGAWNRPSEASLQTIRMGLESFPLRLDPRFATDATSSRINRLLFEPLVDFDESGRFVPRLADWTLLSDRHYRFLLREDRAPFSNGESLQSADVVATYRSLLDPETASPHRASLENIERVEAIDERTIDFHLHHPDPLFPALLVIGIIPESEIDHSTERAGRLSDAPIGSGSFVLHAWEDQISLQLERRHDGQKIELLRVPSPEVRALKLIKGEIDLLQNDLLPELEAYLGEQSMIQTVRSEGTNYAYLGFNLEDPVLALHAVRQAIAHAIDREAIVHYLYHDSARLADSLFPAEHWVADASVPSFHYDPELSRQLLAELGYSIEKPLPLSFKTSTNPFSLRVMTLIQRQLAEVGIEARLQSYDWGTFFGDIREGRFQLFSLQWVGIKTPDIFEYLFHSGHTPPVGANRGRYSNPEVDRLLEQVKTASDLDERIALYRRVQQIVANDLPYISLWHVNHFAAHRDTICGYQLHPDGHYDSLVTLSRECPPRERHEDERHKEVRR